MGENLQPPRHELSSDQVLGQDGRLAKRLPNYESRQQQLEMAAAVETALATQKHLVVEAGTGTGKSFAYLVPAILFATDPNRPDTEKPRRIVVSTHTISLQEQLIEKDLPLLNSVIPREFSAVLVKGRGNYLSLRRMNIAADRPNSLFHQPDDVQQLRDIVSWTKKTEDGSLSDLSFRPAGPVWDEVASDGANCLGRSCQTYQQCFYYKARRRADHAQILIVNHALFFSDLALRQLGASILPQYDAVILDEAHTVESVASDHMGLRISSGQIDYMLNKLYNDRTNKGLLVHARLTDEQREVDQCRQRADDFFSDLDHWFLTQPQKFNGRVTHAEIVNNALSSKLEQLGRMLKHYASSQKDDSKRQDFTAAGERLNGLAAEIERWLKQSTPDSVYWIERAQTRRGLPRTTLAASPVDVGPMLREHLFQRTNSVVLTSATLGVGKTTSFDFYQSRIGLTQTNSLRLGSPFDFQRQATLILVRGMPDPSSERAEFDRLCVPMIQRYALRTEGRAFVLFTSYDMLRKTANQLTNWLRQQNLALLSQADGTPRNRLLELFKQTPRCLLFGTDSFWQGVDVPGDALQNVIITKLPFSVPDQPLLQARLEVIRANGGNPFRDYQLPEAVIKLRQGFGRLIRTRRDRGIVVVLDPRIHTKTYGRTFLESLPKCEVIEESATDDSYSTSRTA